MFTASVDPPSFAKFVLKEPDRVNKVDGIGVLLTFCSNKISHGCDSTKYGAKSTMTLIIATRRNEAVPKIKRIG